MEDEKKIYLKYFCDKHIISVYASPEEKEIFSKVAENQALLNEWNDEFIKISYNEFIQKYSNLSKNDIDGYFIEILGMMSPSKENIQMIINMFNLLMKENLIRKAFTKDDRRTDAIFVKILCPKNWKKGLFIIPFTSNTNYDGLLPYLLEQKRMEEFNLLLDAITPVFEALNYIHMNWLKDFKLKI